MSNRIAIVLGVIVLILAVVLSYFIGKSWGKGNTQTPPTTSTPTSTVTTTPNGGNQPEDVTQILRDIFAAKHNRNVSDIRITIQKQTLNHVMGGVVFGNEGGGMFWAARTNDGWVIVQEGNGTPSCKVLKQYSFPNDMATAYCADVPVPTQATSAPQTGMDFGDAIRVTFCTAKQKAAQLCTLEYRPVCGWFNSTIKCIKYPCAQTYGNICQACADAKVESWSSGECPATTP